MTSENAQVSGRLTPEERAARDRRSQRVSHALRNPTHVTNDTAMRDALVDALGDRPTIGGLRRGVRFDVKPPFDWSEVRRRVDAAHKADISSVVGHSQQRPERRPSFSVVSGPQRLVRTGSAENRERAYGIAVLDAECWRVARTPPGNRNNVLASAAFKVGQRVGADLLEHDTAYSNLLGAALSSGLSERESRPVIRSGLRAGAQKPRQITERNTA
jgi:hypothetical protein